MSFWHCICLLQASGEKVQALMRVSQAEQTAEQAFEETGNLLDQVADLKDRIAQVKILLALEINWHKTALFCKPLLSSVKHLTAELVIRCKTWLQFANLPLHSTELDLPYDQILSRDCRNPWGSRYWRSRVLRVSFPVGNTREGGSCLASSWPERTIEKCWPHSKSCKCAIKRIWVGEGELVQIAFPFCLWLDAASKLRNITLWHICCIMIACFEHASQSHLFAFKYTRLGSSVNCLSALYDSNRKTFVCSFGVKHRQSLQSATSQTLRSIRNQQILRKVLESAESQLGSRI